MAIVKSLEIITPREKFAGAITIFIALAVSIVTLILTAIYAVPKMSSSPPKGHYPDIVKEDEWSTCWEATVFATTSDPFYQWVSGSGLPDALDVSQKGTLAYQRMSIWRISGNSTKEKDCSVYNSPDPHLLGGQFVKRSRTLVWKMTVNWGLSIRSCFTLPGRARDDTCLYTTPIVMTKNGSYAALMIGVPYRKALVDPFRSSSSELYLDREAVYLSNFVSNARASPGLSLEFDEETKRYVYQGPVCDDSSHVLLTPDVLAYLGFPSLQCACSKRVCLVGQNLTDNAVNDDDISPFRLNSTGCYKGKSFWDFDSYPPDENRTIFYLYSTKWRKSISLQVNFTAAFSDIAFADLPRIETFVSCIENITESNEELINNSMVIARLKGCVHPPVVSLTSAFDSVLERYKSRATLASLMETFEKKVPIAEDDGVLCGLDQGQAKLGDKLCALSLEELKSADEMTNLESRLNASLNVAEVRRFVKEEWGRGSSQRSDIIVGLVTAVVTVIVTIWGMFNRDLQEMEQIILRKTKRFKILVERTIGIPLFRTLMRGLVLLGVIVWNMFNVFRSFKSVETKPPNVTATSTNAATDPVIKKMIQYGLTWTVEVEVTKNEIPFRSPVLAYSGATYLSIKSGLFTTCSSWDESATGASEQQAGFFF